MEIVIRVILSIFSFFNLFCCTATFISQYYDNKRLLIVAKQRIIPPSYHNMITISLFCFSFGLIFKYSLWSLGILLVGLLINIFYRKQVTFKFTRRSLSFLFVYLLIIVLSAIFLNNYFLYAFHVLILLCTEIIVIFVNIMLCPYEHFVRKFYIGKAKRKLKNNPNLKIIAITGSFGKTSFKNYLYAILCGQYNVIKTPGSINTPMGICKFINSSLTPYDDILILELGVDAPNTMRKFFKIFHPDIGVITAIGEMHLATFKTIENIQKEKLSLFKNLKEEKAKFYNQDCKLISLTTKDNVHPYSLSEIKIISMSIEGTSFEYLNHVYFAPIFGRHQLLNLLGAIKVAKYLDIREDILVNRLNFVKAEKHRLSVEKINNTYIIDDAYNTNYLGISEAIGTLNSFSGSKGIILNGIIEAGSKAKEINFKLGTILASIDEVVLLKTANPDLKDGLRSVNKKFKVFAKYSEALAYLLKRDLNYILLSSKAENEFIK